MRDFKPQHNAFAGEEGYTLTELMVSIAIGAVILGAGYAMFFKSGDIMQKQMSRMNSHSSGNVAVNRITNEFMEIGYGVPPKEGIREIAGEGLTYWKNSDDVSTNLAGDIAVDQDVVKVKSILGFEVGDTILVYNAFADEGQLVYENVEITDIQSTETSDSSGETTDGGTSGTSSDLCKYDAETQQTICPTTEETTTTSTMDTAYATDSDLAALSESTMDSTTESTTSTTTTENYMVVSPSFSETFPAGASIVVSKYDVYKIAFDSTNHQVFQKSEKEGVIPIVNNVSDFKLVYKDATDTVTTNPSDVQKIEISMTLYDPENPEKTNTIENTVNVRNNH